MDNDLEKRITELNARMRILEKIVSDLRMSMDEFHRRFDPAEEMKDFKPYPEGG